MDAGLNPLVSLLLYVLMPVWMLAGFGDYLCHRWLGIEHNAGERESRLHLLMIGELGAGIAAALFLQLTAAVLAFLIVICIAHEITMWRDLLYASTQRRIPVIEQWLHGIQQAMPWVGLALILVLHREQAAALVGLGEARADWSLRWKDEPLPPLHILAVFLAGGVLVVLPFLGEYRRCRKAG